MAAYIFASIALVISVASAIFLFFMIKKRTSSGFISDLTRSEINNMINELDRITDRDLELVQDRINKLTALLKEVDKHILMSHNEITRIEKSKTAMASYRDLGKKAAPLSRASDVREVPILSSEDLFRDFDSDKDFDSGKMRDREPPDKTQTENLPKTALELHRLGLSQNEIAKHLGITVAEAQLALEMV
ncbi:MAG: hypothetical protein Ta2G_01100 [Termitinemataceae bacterium]|nr:MAG: hypothetical protein Ta2G_01100 [Termitinemataceae bacterium]